MKLFMDNGYLNMHDIMDSEYPYIIVCGGRGTGKTFTTLLECVERKEKFILMRRMQTQIDMLNTPEFSPFNALNSAFNWSIEVRKIGKNHGGIYNGEQLIGYTMALATISNLRGFDASDVERLVFDEFIPERHERTIKNEAAAMFNAYETINRNRELNGRKPLQMIFLANSNRMDNPLFMSLNLVTIAEKMIKSQRHVYTDRNRGIMLVMFSDSPISAQKQDSALYRLTSGSEFSEMALHNDFNTENTGSVVNRPLREYRPYVAVGELTIYEHKNNGMFYVSSHRSGTPTVYGIGEIEIHRFWRENNDLWFAYMRGEMEFESTMCELLFQSYNKNY